MDPGNLAPFSTVACSRDGAAALVTENDNQRHTEDGRAIFDRAHGRGVDHIAGIARDEQFADADAAKQQFRRNAAIGAADDGRPGHLALGDMFAGMREIGSAKLWRLNKPVVPGLQLGQGLIGGYGRGCAPGCEGRHRRGHAGRDSSRRQAQESPASHSHVTNLAHSTLRDQGPSPGKRQDKEGGLTKVTLLPLNCAGPSCLKRFW
jgi:hypothetical protein